MYFPVLLPAHRDPAGRGGVRDFDPAGSIFRFAQKGIFVYVQRFEEVRDKRESVTSEADRKQQLEMESLRLKGQLQELTREVERLRAGDPAKGAELTGTLCGEVLRTNPDVASPVRNFATQLAERGRNAGSTV